MPQADTFPPYVVARRDSLRALSIELGRLILRAENAPLPSSYRSLADALPMRGDLTVAALVDTLTVIEREREDFGIAGGADPVFVALTARVTVVGRAIQNVARARRAEIRRQVAAISPPPVDPLSMSPLIAADTLARRAHLDSLRRTFVATQRTLAAARVKNADVERRAERARELANVSAPPSAMLAAALALGLAAGLGAAVGAEVRHPRVADATEAERAAGVRVLSIVRPRPPLPERARRRVDADAPPLIDRTSEAYRLLYLHFAATGSALPLLTVTGDEPAVAATVATNLAAASAAEARSTLLVDGDFGAAAVAGVLRMPFEPGLADVIRGAHDWAEALQTVTVGRDGALEVMTSGAWRGGPPNPAQAEEIRRDLARIARRYDLTVLVAPEGHVARAGTSLLPAPDVILCARLGATSVQALEGEARALRNAGVRLRGIVLWAADPPQRVSAAELGARRGGAPPILGRGEAGGGAAWSPAPDARLARAH
jgi:Mrp family chromosome partitioning ATPase